MGPFPGSASPWVGKPVGKFLGRQTLPNSDELLRGIGGFPSGAHSLCGSVEILPGLIRLGARGRGTRQPIFALFEVGGRAVPRNPGIFRPIFAARSECIRFNWISVHQDASIDWLHPS